MHDSQSQSYSQTGEEYCQMARSLYLLISAEIDRAQTRNDLSSVYPKLVICAEFFRFIRGEFFLDIRPTQTECQKEMYQMQDELEKRVSELRPKLDLNDSQVKYKLEEARKLFD